jgi:hypothetical protein
LALKGLKYGIDRNALHCQLRK